MPNNPIAKFDPAIHVLTESEAREHPDPNQMRITADHQDKRKPAQIATDYPVSEHAIRLILKRKRWNF